MADAKLIDFKILSEIIDSNTDCVIGRTNPEIKMIYSEKNDILIKMGKKNEWLSKEEIYITNYRGEIQIDAPFTSDYKIFIIKLSSRISDRFLNRRFLIKSRQILLLGSIVEEYGKIKLHTSSEIAEFMIKSLFEQFFLLLFRDNLRMEKIRRNDKSVQNTVDLVITYLKEHMGEDIKFSEIVKRAGLSSTGLKKVFKECTGMGVMQYYSYMKIEKSKVMLAEGEYNVTQTANLLGYESIHYFSRQFKKITGESPTRYINSLKIKS